MSMKFMRKSTVVMMDLVILIFIQVQANDLSSTSLHHSSLSNLNSNPLNPNIKSQEFYGCLQMLKDVKRTWKQFEK